MRADSSEAPTQNAPDHRRGLLIVGLGVLCLIPDGTLVRAVDAPSRTTTFWRALGMLVILGVAAVGRRRSSSGTFLREGWFPLAVSAMLWGAATGLFVAAIDNTAVANALVILSTAPLFSAVFTRAFLHQSVPGRTWLAIPVALAGVVITVAGSLGEGGMSGNLYALLAAVATAANLTLIHRFRSLDMIPATAVGAGLLAVVLLISRAPLAVASDDILPLVLMCVVFNPTAMGLLTVGARHVPSPEVSLMLMAETVLGPVLAAIVVGEAVPSATAVGGPLVVVTLVVHSAVGLGWITLPGLGTPRPVRR